MNPITRALAATTLALSLASPASAAVTYLFEQQGFNGGGAISGTFTGADLDNDGYIMYFGTPDELTAFELNFSGDASVGAFSLGLADLAAFSYEINSGSLGDSLFEGLEGYLADRVVQIGGAVHTSSGGVVTDSLVASETSQVVTVTAAPGGTDLPEPSSWALVGLGALAAWFASRRRPG